MTQLQANIFTFTASFVGIAMGIAIVIVAIVIAKEIK